ncbi:kinase-like domain-containing protein [Hygrophoropsis aurantiaca]|uniref:Kinase-like domain-containing protein n=1 Tax=Hygrophoropsis aurantiaca TaxID=72124 RepID=A0ACB8ACQ0_9AGAM|nr:kinase-like domain-containing protein [Hygrophoropsis aurantiaca]
MVSCPTCQQSFKSKESLNQHVLNSPAHAKLQCQKCELKPCLTKEEFNQHKKFHHRCQLCSYTSEAPFRQWGAQHYFTSHKRKVCKQCISESFASNGQYLNHMQAKHQYCAMCDRTFAQPFFLKKHWEDPKHPSQCKYCMSDVQSVDRATHHLRCRTASSNTELTVPGLVIGGKDASLLQQSSYIPQTSSEQWKTGLTSGSAAHSSVSLQDNDISNSTIVTAARRERPPNQFRPSSLNWIETHRMHLYVQVLESDYSDRKKCKDYIEGIKIYPSLVIYTFFHLQHCVKADNGIAQITRFQEHLEKWKKWNLLETLKNHHIIRDTLRTLLLEANAEAPLSNCPFHVSDEVDGSGMQNSDVQLIAHYLASYLDDSNSDIRTYKDIFALRDDEAQSVIDLLDTLIDHPILDNSQKLLFVDGLKRLSEKSCRYPQSFVLKDIEIASTPCAITGFSDVHRGSARGKQLAVKKIRLVGEEAIENILKTCARETMIWSHLSHPNLLPFYGIFYADKEKSRIALVSPWMENGDLEKYLERVPNAKCEFLAMDISLGIHYLHTRTPKVIHGDLKPNNIYVTSSGTACIGDFGLSYWKDSQRKTASTTQGPSHGGTLVYKAPEMFEHDESISFAGDIYAFGMILYEIFSKKRPFEGMGAYGFLAAIGKKERPTRPKDGITNAFWELIQGCWAQEAPKRPTIDVVVQRLSSFVPQSERAGHIWDDTFQRQLRETYQLLEHPKTFLKNSQ